MEFNRRQFLVTAAAAGLAGCTETMETATNTKPDLGISPNFVSMYGPINSEPYSIPGVLETQLPETYRRQVVPFSSSHPPGTIIVDTQEKFLYSTMPGGFAVRYGVGIGRQGFGWAGNATIRDKQEWPRWHPPAEMIDRQPELEQYRDGGQDPGIDNPLGARALYLYQGNKDTLYRLHGTAIVRSIGSAVSSGCVRLLNHDIIHLYERTPLETQVIVSQSGVGATV